MVIEMHLNGVQEAIFLREKDAEVFLSDYKGWLADPATDHIFEFFHNGSINCFPLSAVVFLKVKMQTETQTREFALSGSLIVADGPSARH